MLELRNITAGYGQFTAIWEVGLRVVAGETVAIVVHSDPVTLTSASIETTPVQFAGPLPPPNETVGYMLFNDHIATAEKGLVNAITTLRDARFATASDWRRRRRWSSCSSPYPSRIFWSGVDRACCACLRPDCP